MFVDLAIVFLENIWVFHKLDTICTFLVFLIYCKSNIPKPIKCMRKYHLRAKSKWPIRQHPELTYKIFSFRPNNWCERNITVNSGYYRYLISRLMCLINKNVKRIFSTTSSWNLLNKPYSVLYPSQCISIYCNIF